MAVLLLVTCAPAVAQPKLNRCAAEAGGETVTLEAEDGVELAGLAFGEGSRGVVLAVGQMDRICGWVPLAKSLRDAGFQVLAYESRLFKPGEGAYRQDRDVVAAAAVLRERGVSSIVAGGGDSGAVAVVVAAPRIPGLAGVFLVAPMLGWGREGKNPMDAVAGIKSVTVPVLILASEENSVAEVDLTDSARQLAEASTSSRLQLVPGKAMSLQLIEKEQVTGEIRKFVGERLPESFLDRYRLVVVIGVVLLVLGLVLVAVLLLRRRARAQAEAIPSGGRPDVVDLG